MIAGRIKNVPTYFLEFVGAIMLVLIFFLIFLGIMNSIFPYGMDLFQLAGSQGSFSGKPISERVSHNFFVSAKGEDASLGSRRGEVFAKISKLSNSVKSKSSGNIAWTKAKIGLNLFNNDAVQTFNNSNALIVFDNDNYLQMGENTLVIIRRVEEDLFLNKKRTLMLVVDGELSGKVVSSGDNAINMEIATPAGIAKIRSKDGTANDVEFNLKVNPDNTATIIVYEGVAEIIVGDKVLKIEKNRVATIALGKAPIVASKLPLPPITYKPRNNKTFYYNDLPPNVRFKWKLEKDTEKYHFILARDAAFKNVIVDEEIKSMYFNHGNLKAGDYFWKVSSMNGWEEGLFSATRKLTVVSDSKAPLLDVNFPPKVINQESYMLTGKTEPESELYIGDIVIKADIKGDFKYFLKLNYGVNVIVVESIDKAGNVTFISQLVTRKE